MIRHAATTRILVTPIRSALNNSFERCNRLTLLNRTLSTKSRLGIGGSRLAETQHGDGRYASVVATSLQNGVRTFECGHGGEEGLRKAYIDAVMYLKDKNENDEKEEDRVTITARFGYRTAVSDDSESGSNEFEKGFPDDVAVEDDAAASPIINPGRASPNPDKIVAYHNISQQYVSHTLAKSPLVELQASHPNVHLIYMAHNPEAQGVEMALKGAPIEDVRGFVKERMIDAFVGLEMGVAEGQIGSYGVCSNGLSLPSSHPLHLGWEDLLGAASDAVQQVHGQDHPDGANLSTLQLPVNLLETYGITVAKNVKQYLASAPMDNLERIPCLPKSIDVFFTRPLTCYPDRGTGSGKPFKLLDYQIPTSLDTENDQGIQWTHLMPSSTPPYYNPTLNATMSHFDANHILEAQHLDDRKLTPEERDTLDGCRLLQSMIHDLDSNLSSGTLRSFAAYEEELYQKVVPLIHNTFEELDEGTAGVLEQFFRVYGESVRCSIARTTRELLRSGKEGGAKYDIGDDESLQEFALKHLWRQKVMVGDGEGEEVVLADCVIVGCPKPEHVVQAMQAADKVDL